MSRIRSFSRSSSSSRSNTGLVSQAEASGELAIAAAQPADCHGSRPDAAEVGIFGHTPSATASRPSAQFVLRSLRDGPCVRRNGAPHRQARRLGRLRRADATGRRASQDRCDPPQVSSYLQSGAPVNSEFLRILNSASFIGFAWNQTIIQDVGHLFECSCTSWVVPHDLSPGIVGYCRRSFHTNDDFHMNSFDNSFVAFPWVYCLKDAPRIRVSHTRASSCDWRALPCV